MKSIYLKALFCYDINCNDIICIYDLATVTGLHSTKTHFLKRYKNLTIIKSSQVNNCHHKFFDGKRTFGFKLAWFLIHRFKSKKRKEFSRTVKVPSMFWRLDYICACGFQNLFFEIATSSQGNWMGWRLLLEIALTSQAPVLYRGHSQTTLTSFWLFVWPPTSLMLTVYNRTTQLYKWANKYRVCHI